MHTPRQSAHKPAVDFELQKASTAGWMRPQHGYTQPDPTMRSVTVQSNPQYKRGKVYTACIRTRKGVGENVVL